MCLVRDMWEGDEVIIRSTYSVSSRRLPCGGRRRRQGSFLDGKLTKDQLTFLTMNDAIGAHQVSTEYQAHQTVIIQND